MGLEDAGRLGSIQDIKNLIQLFCEIMKFIFPIFIVFGIIYVSYRLYIKLSKPKIKTPKQPVIKDKKSNKPSVPKVSLNRSEEELLKELDNIRLDVAYDNKFDSLELEFDENGRAIRNDN